MKYAAGTDKGIIRELNEDSCNIIQGSKEAPYAFIVADGMGGHSCGEIASRMTVDYISAHFAQYVGTGLNHDDCGAALKKLVAEANRAVWQKSLEDADMNGMGTTLTMAVVDGCAVTAAHVGDSRLYLLHDGGMRRVTQDHSYIEELVKNGSLTREEAENHPRKNIITRAIGTSPELEVDIFSLILEADDILLLCTDGLTNMVGEGEIYETVCSNEPEAACGQLIETAKRNGGEDNITVIVIKCE